MRPTWPGVGEHKEESWRVITEQRFAFARLLEGLSDDEWEQPSLCAGWPHSGHAADFAGCGCMLPTRLVRWRRGQNCGDRSACFCCY
jgi:hypothetical protein